MAAAAMSLRQKPTHRTGARGPRAACTTQATLKFTVILLRPDYIAADFGQDTFLGHVDGADPAAAVASARAEAAKGDNLAVYGPNASGADYHVLAVFPGYVPDLNPERR